MTKLLDKAFEAMRTLSAEEQDALARELLARIKDDAQWDEVLSSKASQDWLERAAREALKRRASGETLDYDPANKPS